MSQGVIYYDVEEECRKICDDEDEDEGMARQRRPCRFELPPWLSEIAPERVARSFSACVCMYVCVCVCVIHKTFVFSSYAKFRAFIVNCNESKLVSVLRLGFVW